MAEISTIARPYAVALIDSVRDSKDEGLADKLTPILEQLAALVSDPEVKAAINDPNLTSDQVYDLLRGMLPKKIPVEAENLMKVLAENGRWDAVPDIARQYVNLLHQERKEAVVEVDTPYPMSDKELASLMKALQHRFPGLKLLPTVVIDKSLIGGVKIIVGDQVIDGSVKARLAEMQAALTS
ncbi:MAG: F0F1 ATP synthase subunit delta [Burkholderiales bacterium]|nr:F0F1 ATP synthase subunit delta [Burkholderiales bacterium]